MCRYRNCQIGNDICFFLDNLETDSERMIREYREKLKENYFKN